MDIEALKTFLILADTKNYTRTAEQLFLAQSTITNRIKEPAIQKSFADWLFRLYLRKPSGTYSFEAPARNAR